ncbi:hypothetical protein CXB51_023462 [Gossypium anomalum]|uniref:Uncharacterized protein n=1 Tax=Gossypium anomalum TaxID=47600 RepID=A0A8J5YSC7_9ROSI|nr:hypothetical protein CXB51_023462 [Gossypium anomalum]
MHQTLILQINILEKSTIKLVIEYFVYFLKQYSPHGLLFLFLLQVNGCTRKIGKSIIQAVDSAGIHIIPVSFDNVELYGKVGVLFVMGTTAGDRDRLYKTVEESKVVAFLAAMEIMAEQFPGAFSGYNLQVMESHQAGKLDTSGTAKAIISCFQKLGGRGGGIQMILDPKQQMEMMGLGSSRRRKELFVAEKVQLFIVLLPV